MKDYTDRIYALHGKPAGYIAVNGNILNINNAGHKVFGLLNGRRITDSKSSKEFKDKATPVLSMITQNLLPDDNKFIRISAKKRIGSDYMDNLLDRVRKDKENIKIFLLEMKPDEIEENKPRAIQSSKKNITKALQEYQNDVKKFSDIMKESVELANILLKSDLPESMWGGKEMRKILANIKSNSEEVYKNHEKFEISTEKSYKGAAYIASILENIDIEKMDKSKIARVMSMLTEEFFKIKNTITKTAQNLYGLFDIDRTFKKITKYPATWFFDSSVFYDFQYAFEESVRNVMKAASIEADTMEPLHVWKVKTIGEFECPTI